MTQTASRGTSPGGSSTASAVLMIGWGHPVYGREQKAPQVLQETLQYCKRLQEQGQIESCDPVLLEPHGREMSGFVLLLGSRESLGRIRMSDEFVRLCNRAQLVTSNVDVISGFTGSDFDKLVQDWTQQSRDLT